jgi:hypothetical protein
MNHNYSLDGEVKFNKKQILNLFAKQKKSMVSLQSKYWKKMNFKKAKISKI